MRQRRFYRIIGVTFAVRVLMLGKGWFPSQLGGLDRYFRQLLEQLPEARGVVIGPADDRPSERLTVVSKHSAPLLVRLIAFMRAARRDGLTADVIDAHFALYALLPLLVSRLRRKPLLVHFQGPWAEENVVVGDTSRWRLIARRRLERAVYSRAELVVTLTGAFRRVLVERYGVSPWNTKVLAPGVDVERFSPGDRSAARVRFALKTDPFVVCCARRLTPRMGLDVLIEAWSEVVGRNPQARLLIAGDGELRADLECQINARSLSDSVTLLGRVSDEDLLALYRAADVNVVPSISFEGFGLVVLEAAACGTPSIVTRAGGLPEAIAGLGNDLCVPTEDAQTLAERLARASERQLPSREATRSWAEGHGWEQVAQAHRRLYDHAGSNGSTPAERLRVVYLDHVAQLSGAELALVRLCQALPEVEPHVILAEEGPLVDRLLQAGISVEVLPMRSRTRLLRKDRVRSGSLPLRAVADTIAYSLRLAWRLRQLRPDVVHTNTLKPAIYGSIAARLAGTPLVLHLRDRIEPDYLPTLGVVLVRALTRWLPDVVIGNSEATLRTVRPRGGSVVCWSVVPDLASHHEHHDDHDRDHDHFVVGIAGRLAPWKGQDVFLRAFAGAFPDGEQRAVIIGAPLFGDGEVAYAEGLRNLAQELGIASRVEFRGHRDDMGAELSRLDVLVHASTIPEPFGQVVIEGMSAALPVVASRGGGPEEVIGDGRDGLLFPRGDVAALAEILVHLDAHPHLCAQLGKAAVRRAKAFSPEVIAARVMDAYELAHQ